MSLRKDIGPSEMRPNWYGYAYQENCEGLYVCYPIPLNWIVGIAREIKWWLTRGMFGFKNKELRVLEQKAYQQGWADGFKAHLEGWVELKEMEGQNE